MAAVQLWGKIGDPTSSTDSVQTIGNPMRGYFFMALSALFHAGMSFSVHLAEVSYGYTAISALAIRAAITTLLSLLYIMYHRLYHTFRLSSINRYRLFMITILSSTTTVCTLLALARLPVGTAVTVYYASPIITSILSAIFLSDAFTPFHALVLSANFLGITLVSQPSSVGATSSALYLQGLAFAACSATCISGVYIFTRAMGHSVHFILGVMALGVGLDVYTVILSTASSLHAIRVNRMGTVFACLSACCGFTSQLMLNRGLQDAPAGPAVVVRSLNVPISFLLGLVFMKERPNVVAIGGILLVLTSIAAIGWRQWNIDRIRRHYRNLFNDRP